MRLFSYVVTRDYGFAPNPFYGVCTLATCKPNIRRTAVNGDWIVGTGTVQHMRQSHLVYAMHVDETMTYNEYWIDPRFQKKKPNIYGSLKQAYGDNIYYFDKEDERWAQADSHHSLEGGFPNQRNIEADTKTDRVLIGFKYTYFGGKGPKIPVKFHNWDNFDICKKGPGHKCNFPPDMISSFIDWVSTFEEDGYINAPIDWGVAP